VYKDTKKRGGNTVLFVLLSLFLGFIGAIIWFFVRPPISDRTDHPTTLTSKAPNEIKKIASEKQVDERSKYEKEKSELNYQVERLRRKNENLDLSEIISLLDHPDASQRTRAKLLLNAIEREFSEFEKILEEINEVKLKSSRLTDRLANGDLDSEPYKRALDDLEKSRKEKEERLWKLRSKLFKESEYEKPF
jgi:uncharacterized membrane protein YgaE (UPF0421/DUF939 family)